MAKKDKIKGKAKGKGKGKQPSIPEEWVGKSVEEIKAVVAGLESQLASSKQRRNRAQVEHSSIQSYYDVAREQIRELDMQIEKKDLEIENTIDDNATELRVYQQKANFIKYCHDNRLKEAFGDYEQQMKNSSTDHVKRVENLEAVKTDTRRALAESEGRHINEISNLQQDSDIDLAQLRDNLGADVKLFEQKCNDKHVELQKELDTRRAAELKIVDSRRESHLKDLVISHQHRCKDMRIHFEGVERGQQMDIEDLEAEIRRLKKTAKENESSSNQLKESNERCGEELQICSEKVVTLESKTKDKEKNTTSLRTANARLSATRKAIREATAKYKTLQEKFNMIDEERTCLREGINSAKSEACKADTTRQYMLESNLRNRSEQNAILEQHLDHIVSSAGLDKEKSEVLHADLHEFIQDNERNLEKLNLSIAYATKSYNKTLQSCRLELLQRGLSEVEVDSLNTLGGT